MKQTALNLNLKLKKTRKQVFLEQMEQVVPWAALVELIAPYYPEGKTLKFDTKSPNFRNSSGSPLMKSRAYRGFSTRNSKSL